MPSPKAVLRDIADLGLDPKKSHAITNKTGGAHGGRLNVRSSREETTPVTPVAVVYHNEKVEELVAIDEKQVEETKKAEPVDDKPAVPEKRSRFEKKAQPVITPEVEKVEDEKKS